MCFNVSHCRAGVEMSSRLTVTPAAEAPAAYWPSAQASWSWRMSLPSPPDGTFIE